ncbi:MAG: hypothetical protein ACRDYC_04395 [Acidimicrobiales bacterium]
MATLKVQLDYSEHDCCGPYRQVGDHVEMTVAPAGDQLVEERHPSPDATHVGRVSGRIAGIVWRPAVLVPGPDGIKVVGGYGDPVAVTSTDERPYDVPWAFEFTLETDGEN